MDRISGWLKALERDGVSRRRRWQVIGAVAALYLVRDVLLYVLLPALVLLHGR